MAAPDRVLRVLVRSGFGERVDCKLPGGMNEQVEHRSPDRFPPNRQPAEVVQAVLGRCNPMRRRASAVTGRRRATPGRLRSWWPGQDGFVLRREF